MTGLILRLNGVDDALSVEFYVERENSIIMKKEDLIKVFKGGKVGYYAALDTGKLGRGHLIARVLFEDKENMYPGGARPVVVSGFTGYTIPCMGEGRSIACGGYEVSFEKVNDIPKNEGTNIYAGVVKEWVMAYEFITEEMVKGLDIMRVEPTQMTAEVVQGDRVVIAIPKDSSLVAYKDNGFDGKVPFSTTVMGANGLEMKIDDIRYKLYGEFVAVGGTMKMYIE